MLQGGMNVVRDVTNEDIWHAYIMLARRSREPCGLSGTTVAARARGRKGGRKPGRAAICQTLSSVGGKVTFSTPETTTSRRSIALDPATLQLVSSMTSTGEKFATLTSSWCTGTKSVQA